MPPLRERIDDLPELTATLIEDLRAAHGLARAGIHPDVSTAFGRHAWPGNVRELRNVLERALILAGGGEILPSHLPAGFGATAAPKPQRTLAPVPSVTLAVGTTLDQAEREMIGITLAYTNNNRTRAAELLGIDPKTLYNKLKDRGAGA
jgi:DNA-binding NtrC family response regulator